MEEILIITGGSKGIGSGIVDAYLQNGVRVFSIARTVNTKLSEAGVTQIELDLTKTDRIETEFSKIFNLLQPEKISKITLVNNAGTLGKIGPLEKLDAINITKTITLNTTVPFLCSALFVAHTKEWKALKTIINISSGAALKPYFGWSVYCSTKAAINMLTQTLAVEQAEVENGVSVLAIAPGVVDTDMQVEIRQSNQSDFKDVERFVALKEEGELNNISNVGLAIFKMDRDTNIASGSILRVEGK